MRDDGVVQVGEIGIERKFVFGAGGLHHHPLHSSAGFGCGSGLKNLTNNSFKDVTPAFSPDGRQIAFVSETDGNSKIYLMNPDGSGLFRVTRNAAEDIAPQFSRDGKNLFSAVIETGNLRFMRRRFLIDSYRTGYFERREMSLFGVRETVW